MDINTFNVSVPSIHQCLLVKGPTVRDTGSQLVTVNKTCRRQLDDIMIFLQLLENTLQKKFET